MPWTWVAFSGVATLQLGLLILARWPINSVYILGLFLGIDLIMAGAGWIGLGFGLQRVRLDRQYRDRAVVIHGSR
jgi:uncharacterized membrane protein HdeD (DUF308 family)